MHRLSHQSIAAAIAFVLGSGAIAGPDTSAFDRAVSSYLHGNYDAALPLFQALGKSCPDNDSVHYYLALCYQQLRDYHKAIDEYTWVAEHTKNPSRKEIVEERLRRAQARIGQAARPQLSRAPIAANHAAVRKIIWFSTNWCSTCKRFASAWEAGKSRYQGSIIFEHLNAEDPAAWKLVEKYRPKAYPTLVYLDATDRIIENGASAPSCDEFINHIQELGGKK